MWMRKQKEGCKVSYACSCFLKNPDNVKIQDYFLASILLNSNLYLHTATIRHLFFSGSVSLLYLTSAVVLTLTFQAPLTTSLSPVGSSKRLAPAASQRI